MSAGNLCSSPQLHDLVFCEVTAGKTAVLEVCVSQLPECLPKTKEHDMMMCLVFNLSLEDGGFCAQDIPLQRLSSVSS